MTTQMSLRGCAVTAPAGYEQTILDSEHVQAYPGLAATVSAVGCARGNGNRGLGSSEQPTKETTGVVLRGFADRWYGRVHISPFSINLGNLMTDQNRSITVWNANLTVKTLSNVSNNTDQGVLLSSPTSYPAVLEPLQQLEYQLSISMQGPPVISGSIDFLFAPSTYSVTLSGSRVVVWPFSPQEGYSENLEWLTDISRSKNKEQRVALRSAPRQYFEYQFMLNGLQASKARAMAVGWGQRQYGLPVWHEAQYVGKLAEGATSLAVDTSNSDYKVGSALLIWVSDSNFEAIAITEIKVSTVELALPVSRDFSGAYVMPMKYARSTELSMSRSGSDYAKVRANFAVTDNTALSDTVDLPIFKSLPVLTDAVIDIGGYEDKIIKEVSNLDNRLATPVLGSMFNSTDQYFMVAWDLNNKQELWRVRKFLHSLRGKQKTFWLPAPTNDMKLTAPIDASSGGITVQKFGGSLFYSNKTIQVLQRNGTRTFHNVVGISDAGPNEVLNLEANAGITVAVNENPRLSFMYKVRLDVDRVEINYKASSHVTIRVPVKEVEN